MTAKPLLAQEVYDFAKNFVGSDTRVCCRDQDYRLEYPVSIGSLQVKDNHLVFATIPVPSDPFTKLSCKRFCELLDNIFGPSPEAKECPFVVQIRKSFNDEVTYPVVDLKDEVGQICLKYYNVQTHHYKIWKD